MNRLPTDELNNWLNDFDIIIGERISLEPEDIKRARKISKQVTEVSNQWQTYINILAFRGFLNWLDERIVDIPINDLNCSILYSEDNHITNTVCKLKVGDHVFCLLTPESLIRKTVTVPKAVVELPKFAAHFYVVIEVWDEEEQISLRGFHRHSNLLNSLNERGHDYELPFTAIDEDLDHLLYDLRLLPAPAIVLPPVASISKVHELLLEKSVPPQPLEDWMYNFWVTGWQFIEQFHRTCEQAINELSEIKEAVCAAPMTARKNAFGFKFEKLINLGTTIENIVLVLLIIPEENEEFEFEVEVNVQSLDEATYLPVNLEVLLITQIEQVPYHKQLTVPEKTFQLANFKTVIEERFKIQVSLNGTTVTETFSLKRLTSSDNPQD